jgi:hypothetical protein
MVVGLHIHICSRSMKPIAIALSGMNMGLQGRDGEENLTNV